jgi:penicillin-binding protein 2
VGISDRALDIVREGMNRVTNFQGGTAYSARISDKGLEMAGKTGTAQVRRISKAERETRVLKNHERPWKERDHALFVGYAPTKNPRYAAAVIVEHGGGGSKVAAPIARDLLRATQMRDPSGSDVVPNDEFLTPKSEEA